jgi:hypothetical protein
MFDAQVVLSPKSSPRGRLLSQYVLARITRMDNVDIGLFDYDRNNTLYYFAMNADEQIYLRYGGRDSRSPDSYLNLASIELALEKGLELHRRYLNGEIQKAERPAPLFPREIPLLVERTFARNNCVECHLIGDFQNIHREQDGTLDKPRHLYRSPDIQTIGITLDVPKGLLVKETTGAAQAAGMRSGDTITAVNQTPVYTFGDLQHTYDRLPRDSQSVRFTVERGGVPVEVTIALPVRWWLTDIRYRQATIDPRTYFDSRPLSEEEKRKLNLLAGGFASEVTHVDMFAEVMKSHALKPGDIIYRVDGAETDPIAHTPDLHIKLRKKAGDSVKLGVIRNGAKMEMELKTFRMAFRK